MTGEKTTCIDALTSAASLFRLGMEGQASENMVKFIDTFLPELGGKPPEQIAQLTLLLNDIMTAQSRKDYLRVADLLEYELLPKINAV